MLRLPFHNQRLHLLLRSLSSFASITLFPKHFTPSERLLPSLSSKPIPKNHSFSLRTNGFSSFPSPSFLLPLQEFLFSVDTGKKDCCLIVYSVLLLFFFLLRRPNKRRAYCQDLEDQPSDTRNLQILKHELKQLGIDITECVAGRENRLMCPSCNGGESEEISLSLFINQNGYSASWLCFRAKCGWKSYKKAVADRQPSIEKNLGQVIKVKVKRQITVESLQLEPLCNQLTAYFAERMISAETLKRNAIMQKTSRDKEKGAEKILYGLDDIEDASDIIIVEGEMDKLAMEEAGFRNCVSVPDGAPPSVSKREVPAEEQDKRYRYLWNCEEYLKKASRIILATDGDPPGQALAEELARRLGKESINICLVWVKDAGELNGQRKNDVDHFKDANEVLMIVGPSVLKDVIDNAEFYPIRGLVSFRNFFDEIDQYYHQNLRYEFGGDTT